MMPNYRVKKGAAEHAKIRGGPRTNARVLGQLYDGEDWHGTLVPGQLIYVRGFGSSNMWARSVDMHFVWSGILEDAKDL